MNLPAQFSFNFDVWAGVERRSNAKNRIWVGVDLGEYGSFCTTLDEAIEEGASVAYSAIASAVEGVINEAADAVDKDEALDLAFTALKGIVVLVALFGIGYVLSTVVGAVTISGSAAAAAAGGTTIVLSLLG